jgi:hypothetical protein
MVRTKQELERPTEDQFRAYQAMYDYFNRELFEGKLPGIILNFSRRAGTYGFFAPQRWEGSNERVIDEISINPAHLRTRHPIDTTSTLVHEMVHQWQQEFGSPSRTGYHNAEWAEKMESIGLVPSDTGQPGGRRVGQRVSHYILEDGPFARAFARMPEKFLLPWRAGETDERGGRRGGKPAPQSKLKYTCSGCGLNAWGKPDLHLVCGKCDEDLVPGTAKSKPTERETLEEFAARVQQAASKLPAWDGGGRTSGKPHEVYISAIAKQLGVPARALDAFKSYVVAAHGAGLIALSRLDVDDGSPERAASEAIASGLRVHLVRI